MLHARTLRSVADRLLNVACGPKAYPWANCFNPRPRVGGDLPVGDYQRRERGFNPRPRVGGDRTRTTSVPACTGFNPRPRVGGDSGLYLLIKEHETGSIARTWHYSGENHGLGYAAHRQLHFKIKDLRDVPNLPGKRGRCRFAHLQKTRGPSGS